ncbi:hypothetical protein GCM10010466_51680 [Planomonospora alba]|uniref:Uncharacterized protein n=1 Tax=Planomonospora alba TaxID=161354 RepID=A0ABP6NP36_9ACTN
MLRWHRPLLLCSGLLAVLALACLGGLLLDDRTLDGVPVWAKPLKFAVSFAVYTLTWAWLLSLLRRTPRGGRRLGTVLAAASAFETALITFQAARGTRSHFNVATEADTAIYTLMGATATVLMAANMFAALLVLRERRADPVATRALRWGLALSAAGIALGYLMVLPTPQQLADPAAVIGAHGVGVPDGGPGLPLLGWSTTGGDLRVPHFVGMHAVQVLPLLALALSPLRDRGAALRLVTAAGAGYAGLLALVTWQALRGQPLLRPDGATLTAAALLLVAVTAGALSARRSPHHPTPEHPAPDRPGPARPGPAVPAETEAR